MNPLHQTQDGKCDEFVRQSQETLDGIFKPIQDLQEQQREGWVSDTPETDLEEAIQTQRFGGYMVKSDFARKLERERDGLKEYAERCKQGCIKLSFAIGQIDYVCGEPNDMEVSDYCLHQNEEAVVERVKTKIAGLERERDEAREALSGRTVSCSQCNAAAAQIAALRKALEKALAVHKAITTYSLDQSLADREANEQHCAMMEKALSETRP